MKSVMDEEMRYEYFFSFDTYRYCKILLLDYCGRAKSQM